MSQREKQSLIHKLFEILKVGFRVLVLFAFCHMSHCCHEITLSPGIGIGPPLSGLGIPFKDAH